jgi:hypothetical protein
VALFKTFEREGYGLEYCEWLISKKGQESKKRKKAVFGLIHKNSIYYDSF